MNRHSFLIALASTAALAVMACANNHASEPSPAALRPLTVDQVAARIAAHDGKTFVFDDNPKEIWVRGHVPGAKWLDEDNVTAAALPGDKAATLIFYCHSET